MEIASGIHQINGIRGANCYLVCADSKMVLIDTGMPGNGKKIIRYIEKLGKNPTDISYVVLTHADIDHIGSAAAIKKMTGTKLVIQAADAPTLSGRCGFKTARGFLGVIFKLATPLMRFQAVEPDSTIKGNSEINGFQAILTPGHTMGSMCLYWPGNVIFVGDALRSDSQGNPRPPARQFSANLAQAKSSLREISRLEFDILLPGHGAPVIGKASTRLRELVEHIK